MSNASNTQIGGDHYKSMAIQPTQFIHANRIPFIEANVIKYVCRHRAKNKAEDIKKAIHYLELLLELEYPEPYVLKTGEGNAEPSQWNAAAKAERNWRVTLIYSKGVQYTYEEALALYKENLAHYGGTLAIVQLNEISQPR